MKGKILWALLSFAMAAQAQWEYRAAGIPRTADGKPNLSAPAPKTAWGTIDFSGVWQTDSKYNLNLAADLPKDAVPMTPWAQALYDERQRTNGATDPEGFCLPPGIPRVNGVPFPVKIVQTPAVAIVLYETRTTFRQVFLDNHKVIRDPNPTWMGYSTGKWDGDALIVETVGFNDKTWLDDVGHPHSEELRVTERWRRPNFGHMVVDITITDPVAYTRPWTVTQEFVLAADDELLEYVCGENNVDPPHLVSK
jgi:hypothetical protein